MWGKSGSPAHAPCEYWFDLVLGALFALALITLGLLALDVGARLAGHVVLSSLPAFKLFWLAFMGKAPPSIKELNAFYEERATGMNPLGALNIATQEGGDLSITKENENEHSFKLSCASTCEDVA